VVPIKQPIPDACLIVVDDTCHAIGLEDSLAKAWGDMQAVGVRRMQTSHLKG